MNINTQVLGLIGYPLGHSLSPLLHNQAIKELKLNYVYLAYEVKPENLQKAIEGIRALNIRGINVTIPFKEKVIPFLDEVDPLAQQVGAVNTICNDGGRLKGYNTDVVGLRRLIEEDGRFKIRGKKAVIVGAGGAGRAAGFALCQAGVGKVHLLNRSLQKAVGVAEEWRRYYPETEIDCGPLEVEHYRTILKEAEILIDTTPIGMFPVVDVPPVIVEEALHPGLMVVDLVYNPRETALLKAARRAGANTLDGLGMLLYQGMESFKIWTGFTPSYEAWLELVSR